MLQFITNGKDAQETISQILKVIEGGCRWVQIRMKHSTPEAITSVIDSVSSICKERGVILIVDDHVEIAMRPDVDGVHLGQKDKSPKEAREILGPDKIIGLTVNTLEQAESADFFPVNYYGVGPWRYTVTKEKLAPILGPAGVTKIVKRLKEANPERQIVVIGGVTLDDVCQILSLGADGIAVSGILTQATDMRTTTRTILNEITKYTKI